MLRQLNLFSKKFASLDFTSTDAEQFANKENKNGHSRGYSVLLKKNSFLYSFPSVDVLPRKIARIIESFSNQEKITQKYNSTNTFYNDINKEAILKDGLHFLCIKSNVYIYNFR